MSEGAPTPTEVIKAIYQKTGIVLQIRLLCNRSRSGANTNVLAQSLSSQNKQAWEELGSVGTPLGNLEICIFTEEVSKEDGYYRTGDEVTFDY